VCQRAGSKWAHGSVATAGVRIPVRKERKCLVAESALARNLGAKKADAKNSARRGDTGGAWPRMGLGALKQRAERYTECVAHSVGQVQEFLARTPAAGSTECFRRHRRQ